MDLSLRQVIYCQLPALYLRRGLVCYTRSQGLFKACDAKLVYKQGVWRFSILPVSNDCEIVVISANRCFTLSDEKILDKFESIYCSAFCLSAVSSVNVWLQAPSDGNKAASCVDYTPSVTSASLRLGM